MVFNDAVSSGADEHARAVETRAAQKLVKRRRRLIAALSAFALVTLLLSTLLLSAPGGAVGAHVAGYVLAGVLTITTASFVVRMLSTDLLRTRHVVSLVIINTAGLGVAFLHALSITRRFW